MVAVPLLREDPARQPWACWAMAGAAAATLTVSLVLSTSTGPATRLFQTPAATLQPQAYRAAAARPPVQLHAPQSAGQQLDISRPSAQLHGHQDAQYGRTGQWAERPSISASPAPLLPLIGGVGALAMALGAVSQYRTRRDLSAQAEAVGDSPVTGQVVYEFDGEAVLRYIGATAMQWGLILGTLWVLDKVGPYLVGLGAPAAVPQLLVTLFFAFTALKSRVFSPLDNSRPTVAKEKQAIDERIRPSWMPPPLVFPIVWTTIAVLRTVAGVMVWLAAGKTLLVAPIMAHFLMLSIGDTWNTINNVERRMGTAAFGVCVVWLSALVTNIMYYNFYPTAGLVLAFQQVWLTIATVLVNSIWRLNGAEPMYPFKKRFQPA
uniref:Uncharacterized protein n=1 Tax=Eutreptiella gymnastica TaxID=73025 RepID=A0A7S1JAC1_9EUGL|mmetsp:Transcript_7977/g.14212  ORF Transcript_7977/g.14212 Transcript_7977/m.14212 type:complete len:377 (+) Transcript_7977:193-1323(+)